MSREVRLSKMYVSLFQELYDDFIDLGIKPEQAQCRAHEKVSNVKELIEDVLDELDEDNWYCSLRRVLPTGMIDNWTNKTIEEKELTLYNLGMDIRLPWKVKRGPFLCGDKRMEGEHVIGSERLDGYWCNGPYASMAAIIEYEGRVRGRDHKLDLEEMNRN